VVRDPGEGVAADGTITTGAARSRVPQVFEPVLSTAARAIAAAGRDASAYLYGSVATGQARPGSSDVDLLTVGLDPGRAAEIGREERHGHEPPSGRERRVDLLQPNGVDAKGT